MFVLLYGRRNPLKRNEDVEGARGCWTWATLASPLFGVASEVCPARLGDCSSSSSSSSSSITKPPMVLGLFNRGASAGFLSLGSPSLLLAAWTAPMVGEFCPLSILLFAAGSEFSATSSSSESLSRNPPMARGFRDPAFVGQGRFVTGDELGG